MKLPESLKNKVKLEKTHLGYLNLNGPNHHQRVGAGQPIRSRVIQKPKMADFRYLSFVTFFESVSTSKLFSLMDVSYIYALTTGGAFLLLFIIRSASWLVGSISQRRLTIIKHALSYYIVERHRLFGPWTRNQLLLVLLVLVVNTLSTLIGTSTIEDTGNRAGILSLINLIPCYFGFNLSFAGDLLGISPRSYSRIHALAGLMSSMLGLLHMIIEIATKANLSLFRASGQLLSFLVSARTILSVAAIDLHHHRLFSFLESSCFNR